MSSPATPAGSAIPARRSWAELAATVVDTGWLCEIAQRRHEAPAEETEAAAQLRALSRAETVFGAARMQATERVARLADLRNPDPQPGPGEDLSKRPPSTATLEVAAALRISSGSAQFQIDEARLIRGLPGITLGRLLRGETTLGHVRRLVQLARNEESEMLLAECEEAIWKRADEHPDWTPDQLQRAAARIMAAREPDALARDHSARREMSNVTIEPEPDTGMAWLHAYLPMLEATIIKTAVDAAAAAARAAGDRRPTGMLRAEALTLCAEAYLNGDPPAEGQDGPAGAGGAGSGGRPTSHRRPVEVHVIAPLTTVLGLADLPGELPGNGLIPADVVRELAVEAKLRLVTYDPASGTLLDYGQATYRAPAALAAKVKAKWQMSAGIGSSRPAARCDLDHLEPYAAGGPTSDGNMVPLDRRTHRIRTHDPGLTVSREAATGRLTWTTPFGQRVETYPYDWRLGP